jgi:Mrp family chromosome partitioning ATPase
VQSATLPVKPDKPKKLYTFILAVFFGIFGALSLTLIAEFLDHSIKSSNDIISFLKQPVIAQVPYFDSTIVRTRNFSQKSLNIFDNIGRTVHASFQSGGYSNVIGITSCYIGEGTSFIASRIADAMISFQDGDVLYADLNFDNPDLQNRLSFATAQQSKNVHFFKTDNYISQENDSDQSHEIVVIPAGKQAHLPIQYVQKKRFDQFINYCTTKYSSIVFDMPPLSESTMVLEMAAHIDGLVLVIESGKVRREVVRQMIFDITQAGINIIGIVLNKQKHYIPQFIYNKI